MTTLLIDDYRRPSFSDEEWTPELVILCLQNRWLLNELALWGASSSEWPPHLGTADIARNYPADINIMTTRVDFQRAWASLSRKERRLLDMYYLEGKTQEEIATQLRCSQPNISQTITRKADKLKRFLGCQL